MPRRFSTAEVEAFLLKTGFVFVRQRGSHKRYRGTFRGRVCNVGLVAGQKQIPDGTLVGIASQLGLGTTELKRLLSA